MADQPSPQAAAHGMIVRSPSREQSKDTGLAVTLICLIVALFTGRRGPVVAATVALVLTMTAPALFKPAAVVWLTFSNILGAIMSRLLLSLVFFLIVTPVGWIRRRMGHDTLKIRSWKTGTASVFENRHHPYTPDDINRPY